MQTSTIVVLTCLLAIVVVQAQQEPQAVVENIQESVFDTPVHDRSPRNKRGLLLLKKKLILGALGLKAAKVGAAAGVVGALAYKSKSKPKSVHHVAHTTHYHHGLHPSYGVEVHRTESGGPSY